MEFLSKFIGCIGSLAVQLASDTSGDYSKVVMKAGSAHDIFQFHVDKRVDGTI